MGRRYHSSVCRPDVRLERSRVDSTRYAPSVQHNPRNPPSFIVFNAASGDTASRRCRSTRGRCLLSASAGPGVRHWPLAPRQTGHARYLSESRWAPTTDCVRLYRPRPALPAPLPVARSQHRFARAGFRHVLVDRTRDHGAGRRAPPTVTGSAGIPALSCCRATTGYRECCRPDSV